MLLDYASPLAPFCRLGLSIVAAIAAIGGYAMAGWCVVHALHVNAELAKLNGPVCGNYVVEVISSLGLPLEKTIPLGVLSGGFAMVATIQSIRSYNGVLGGRGL